MKLTKEQVYVDLQGKTKEELTDLWEFLTSNGEKCYRDKEEFSEYPKEYKSLYLCYGSWSVWYGELIESHTEITIDQLKEIIKPMETFTPIAMRCTYEQFEAVKLKLSNIIIEDIYAFSDFNYLTNNYRDQKNVITNVDEWSKDKNNRTVHEEWNEEIFLKACGIEVETLQEKALRLENELKDVNKQIEEENKPKVGDWVYIEITKCFFKADEHDIKHIDHRHKKITNTELIKLLEQEIK